MAPTGHSWQSDWAGWLLKLPGSQFFGSTLPVLGQNVPAGQAWAFPGNDNEQ